MRRLCLFLLAFMPMFASNVEASLIPEWMDHRMYLVARIGDDYISNYDLYVDVLVTRALDHRISERPPYDGELKRSAAQLVNRRIIVATMRNLGNMVPDADEIQRNYRIVLDAYGGSVTRFEQQTGLTERRLMHEATQRAIADAYLRTLFERTVRGTADFSNGLTEPGSDNVLRPMREEFRRLRERFLERNPFEILDGPLTRDDFLQDVLPFASN